MIIGFTGTNGAGKTTTARYLEKKGFVYHSLSDILREALAGRKIAENLDNLLALGNSLRKEFGAGVLGKKTLEKIITNKEEKSLVDSIRHPNEVKELKKSEKFVLVAIDAPIKLRYERISKRHRADDKVSFEKFRAIENSQLNGKGGDAQLLECIKLADYKIENSGTFEELYKKVEDILQKIAK